MNMSFATIIAEKDNRHIYISGYYYYYFFFIHFTANQFWFCLILYLL